MTLAALGAAVVSPVLVETTTSAEDGLSAPTTTAASEASLADPNFFVDWLPELRTAPAPDWVTQGTRLTYYAAAASVPGSYHQYVEDENGAWIDPTTGTRYSQEDIPGAAGHGFNQVTVAALNDDVAALSIRAYGLTDLPRTSPVTTITWGGAVGLPGAGSDYWLHPAVLAQVADVVTPELKVLRMPYRIEAREYSAIWIQSLSDGGNLTWVYDLDSGLLLHTASSTVGAPITGPVAEGEGREGATFLTQSTLVNVRQPPIPWAASAAPGWIGSINHLEYEGRFWVEIAGTPTGDIELSLAVDRRASGTGWVRYLFTQSTWTDITPAVTNYVERVDGSGQVAAMWVPPDALAQLSAGQEIDRDPVTQVAVTVAAVDPTDSGFTVTIREAGAGETSDLVYDGRTGLLVSSSHTDLGLGAHTDLQLVSWS